MADELISREAVHDMVSHLTRYAWTSPVSTEYRTTIDADEVNFGLDKIPAVNAVVLPCKVGDTVWFIRPLDSKKEITETVIEKMVIKSKGVYMKLACNAMYETSCNSIGKSVFLTKEEAEAALEGREKNATDKC